MRKTSPLAGKSLAAIPRRVGRKLEYPDKYPSAFVRGTLMEMDSVLASGETRAGFIRDAVRREIEYRKRAISE